jgi:tRNA 2-thiouridine synthesizing protein A
LLPRKAHRTAARLEAPRRSGDATLPDAMTDTATTFDREVDARGLNCPLPILRAKKALADLETGQVLKVVSTDPGSQRDFEAFARQTGHELVKLDAAAREWTFYLKHR